MALSKSKTYLVFNYNPYVVSIATRSAEYSLDPCSEDGIPNFIPLTMDDIIYINSRTAAFRTGLLRFEKEFEKDIYAELRISNWEEILTNKEIEEIILSPTVDGLKRLIDANNLMLFDRIRSVFIGLRNSGAEISNKIDKLIAARYAELMRGKKNTAITITGNVVDSARQSEDIDALKREIEELKQLVSMQAKATSAPTAKAAVEAKPAKQAPKTTAPKGKTSSSTHKTTNDQKE